MNLIEITMHRDNVHMLIIRLYIFVYFIFLSKILFFLGVFAAVA